MAGYVCGNCGQRTKARGTSVDGARVGWCDGCAAIRSLVGTGAPKRVEYPAFCVECGVNRPQVKGHLCSSCRHGLSAVPGKTAVQCWCGSRITYVETDLWERGETGSCGREGCTSTLVA